MSEQGPWAADHAIGVQLALAQRALDEGRLDDAYRLAESVIGAAPQTLAARLIASKAAIFACDHAKAMRQIDAGLAHDPDQPELHLYRARCLIALQRFPEARAALAVTSAGAARLPATEPATATMWGMIGDAHGLCGDYAQARDCYDQAISIDPGTARHVFNRAAVNRYLGETAAAAADYARAIDLEPAHAEAYFNLVHLQRQTPARNRIAALERLVGQLPATAATLVPRAQARFALAKSYEDLGDGARSFAHLDIGARLMRGALRYDVQSDLAVMAAMQALDWRPDAPLPAIPAHGRPTPIFVLGLPRSGSTVIERILTSHDQVGAIGESAAFPQALAEAAQQVGPVSAERDAILRTLARIDPVGLGARYLSFTAPYRGPEPCFVDKLPANHQYVGVIARALPSARIVHITRHPLANLYGLYKTLFNRANPWSYDPGELIAYYMAYRQIMQHWRALLGDRLIEISLEALVDDPDYMIPWLVERCGLPWQPACLRFHANPLPSTTHSASQVRRPLNRDGIDGWRRFAEQIEPLRARLLAAGMPPEALA